jgi:phage-related protein
LKQYSFIAIFNRMAAQKSTIWIGSSRDDLRAFPDEVRRVMGFAINDAQNGDEHPRAKALKGFGGRSVLEIVDDDDGNTYRAIYTVRFAGVIYVLHAFQKKSKRGIETPKRDIEIIKARLKTAEAHYRENYGGTK